MHRNGCEKALLVHFLQISLGQIGVVCAFPNLLGWI